MRMLLHCGLQAEAFELLLTETAAIFLANFNRIRQAASGSLLTLDRSLHSWHQL
jgi:hypothetical protein